MEDNPMKRYLTAILCSTLLLIGMISVEASAQAAGEAEAHVAAAKAIAASVPENAKYDLDYRYMFDSLCTQPKPTTAAQDAAALNQPANLQPRPSAEWYVEPARVFDNLYYLGTKTDSIWAVTTSAGIILIDADYHWNVEELVVGGMKKVGLDPANIKYLIITHAHVDHYGGAKYIQDHFHPRLLMSEADWNVVAKDNTPAEMKPKKDMVAMDGQKLTLGDTTLTLYMTPGHTPGTTSLIIPLKDGNDRHVGAIYGGVMLSIARAGVPYFPDWPTAIKTHLGSLRRLKEIEAKAGVDTVLTIHSMTDKSMDKLAAVRVRKPGEPHPYVSKALNQRFTTVLDECMSAQLAWRTKS
jgi:metallo-beta-lactamase class B